MNRFDDPGPRRDPWWILALGLLILVLLLWILLERTNSPEPGAVKEGRASSRGWSLGTVLEQPRAG